jgi:tetratricopeptide (TPR) repeat protein
VGRTIRTCSLALATLLAAAPAAARQEPVSALSAYVQGRALDASGQHRDAAIAYGLALSADPGDGRVAMRAFRQAIEAGEMQLALRAARALETAGAVPHDARLLLYLDDVQRGNWRGARAQLDALDDGSGFDFLVPHLRAWTRFAARDGDAVAELDAGRKSTLSGAYVRDSRALLLLALKRPDDALATIRTLAVTDGRDSMLRLAAAARLAQLGRGGDAAALLARDTPAFAAARTRLDAGSPLPGAVTTAQGGAAFLLARVSADLTRDGASPAALTLARLARFADPDSSHVALVLAQTLNASTLSREALAAVNGVEAPYDAFTRELRIGALQQAGAIDEALALATAHAREPGATLFDHARLGEVLSRLKRHDDAARAYQAAIAVAGADGAPWNLWLLYGGALDQAGQWPAARAALHKAVELAPEEPSALNHLGYAMLERGDDPVEATRHIAKANMLKPDDPAITDSLGWAFFLRGRTLEAIALLERAVAAEPREAVLSEHLGDAYWEAGRRIDARYAWQAALAQTEVASETQRLRQKIADGLPPRRK